MIRFYIGKSSTGKTFRIMNDIKNSNGKNLIYLVPEQFNLEAEKELIEKMNLKGLINIDVLSFDWLIKNVIKSVGGINKIEIDDFGRSMIIRRILDSNKDKLEFYKKSINKKGLIDQLSGLFKKIKENRYDKRLLDEIFSSEEIDESLKIKSKDIILIYSEFIKYSSDKYFDDDDKLDFIISHIDETKVLKNASIWIDGFHGFSQLQISLIEKMMNKCIDLTIVFTLDPEFEESETFRNVRETYITLQEKCKENNLKYEIITFDENINFNKELNHLSENIFKYPSIKYNEELKNIEGLIGTNLNKEIELVSIKIKELIRNSEYSWKDIGLVVTDLSKYKNAIKSNFYEYDIPYFIDEKISITNNPIIQFIISTLKIYQKNYRYEDIFSVIKTTFTNLDKDESEILENYVMEYGIQGYLWKKDFLRGKNKLTKEELEYINKLREKFITPFINFFEKINKKELDVSKFTIEFYNFLKDYGLVDSLEKWIFRLKNLSEIEKVNENTQIWNIIMKIIEQFVELFQDKKLSLKEYIKILEEGISEYEVGILPSLQDEVMIGDIHRTKISDLKVLFVVGINDGLLPRKIENNDVFSEEEKDFIKDKGLDLKNDIEYKISEENYLIYRLFSKPKEKLFLSYSLSNNEGKSLRPSIIIDKVKNIFKKVNFTSNLEYEKNMENKLVVTKDSTLKYLVGNLRKNIDGYNINQLWFHVYKWYFDNDKVDVNWINQSLFHDNTIKDIDEEFSKQLFELPLKASGTRLNTYIDCPFKHFVKYGLKPYEMDNFEIELPDLGLMFHKSLEEFGYKLKKEKLKWEDLTRKKCDDLITDIINEITDEYSDRLFNENYRNKYYKRKILRVAKRSIWTLRDHVLKGQFVPKAFELKFSENLEGLKPIVLDLRDDEKMILEGTIDRLDILKENDDTYVKVIDYKSGNSDLKLTDIYNGNKTQLIIYLDALINDSKYFGFDNVIPAGVYYFKIDDPIIDYNLANNVENLIIEEMKMSGIGIKDKEVIKKMDSSLEDSRKSSVFDVKFTKKDEFSKRSKVIEKEDFDLLIKHVRGFIKEIGNEIIDGKSDVFPLQKNQQTNACSYCNYSGFCQFDKQLDNNDFRKIKKYKDQEVIELLNKSGENNG